MELTPSRTIFIVMLRRFIYTLLISIITVQVYGAVIKLKNCSPVDGSTLNTFQKFTLTFDIDEFKAENPDMAESYGVSGYVSKNNLLRKGIYFYKGSSETGTKIATLG